MKIRSCGQVNDTINNICLFELSSFKTGHGHCIYIL